MSKFTVLLAVVLLSSFASAQSFECYPLGPLPTDPSLGCEGVAGNGLGLAQAPQGATAVTNTASCGFPTVGTQYLRIAGNGQAGGWVPTVGGPFPRPAPATVSEVRIPIPVGATSISFDWEFFNRECAGVPPANTFYDGMSIDVVTFGGGLIQNLVFADTTSPEGACSIGTDYCQGAMAETFPNGANQFTAALPTLTGCEYVSVVAWNGNDNSYPPLVYLDNITFDSAAAPCAVPCFVVGGGSPSLGFSSPSGTGCILVTMQNMPAGGIYYMPVIFNAGNYPNGWFHGIDPTFQDLANTIAFGYPFIGPIGGTPCTPGGVTIGEFCGVPSGLTIYAVSLGFPAGSNYPTAFTPPATYTIP
jgi:hypothetical protein